jgi:single-strand DNA-binding protein
MTSQTDAPDQAGACNCVLLRGRVSMVAGERQLPSGDAIVTTRVVVDRGTRPVKSGQARSRQRVDAIDCVAWSARVQRAVRRWSPGDEVQVEGSLRRRFYRGDRGLVSRFEVEITKARLVSPATRRAGRRRSREEPEESEESAAPTTRVSSRRKPA